MVRSWIGEAFDTRIPMAFFRTVSFSEQTATIEGAGVVLRPPFVADYEEWATLREKSREFLTPWEPTWPVDDLTRSAFRRRLRRYAEDQRSDQSYAFFIFCGEGRGLVGGVTLANVRRGVAQAGSVGYWIGAPFRGAAICVRRCTRLRLIRFPCCACTAWRRPVFRPTAPRSDSQIVRLHP